MIPQFALSLVCGLSLTWCLMPRRQVTSGFFRIQNLLTLGLSVLAILTLHQLPSVETSWLAISWIRAGTVLAATISFIASVLWTLERRGAAIAAAFLLCGVSLVLLIGSLPDTEGFVHFAYAALSSAWLLGGSMAAMLLGHWYLTARGMPLDPLVRLNRNYCLAIIARAAPNALFLVIYPTAVPPHNYSWLLLRWSGLIGPFVMVLLVFRILRYRNTQSATGVLFASVILVFMGEMAAALLSRSTGLPF